MSEETTTPETEELSEDEVELFIDTPDGENIELRASDWTGVLMSVEEAREVARRLDFVADAIEGGQFMVEMIPVESSMIKTIGYEEGAGNLFVEFNSGEVYRYPKVEQALFAEFLAAGSKGQFFNANIKGVYEFEKQ